MVFVTQLLMDVLVGISLPHEGMDKPEVSLVAILNADKEGFLQAERSLIQRLGGQLVTLYPKPIQTVSGVWLAFLMLLVLVHFRWDVCWTYGGGLLVGVGQPPDIDESRQSLKFANGFRPLRHIIWGWNGSPSCPFRLTDWLH